jgi:uncharacterized membrane protein
MVSLAPVFVAVSLLFIGLAVPLIKRRVGPNRLYGLRVPATLVDEWVWYEANAQSGRDLAVMGVMGLLVAVLLPLAPNVTLQQYALVNVLFLLLGMLMFAVTGWRRANRLLAQRRAEGR